MSCARSRRGRPVPGGSRPGEDREPLGRVGRHGARDVDLGIERRHGGAVQEKGPDERPQGVVDVERLDGARRETPGQRDAPRARGSFPGAERRRERPQEIGQGPQIEGQQEGEKADPEWPGPAPGPHDQGAGADEERDVGRKEIARRGMPCPSAPRPRDRHRAPTAAGSVSRTQPEPPVARGQRLAPPAPARAPRRPRARARPARQVEGDVQRERRPAQRCGRGPAVRPEQRRDSVPEARQRLVEADSEELAHRGRRAGGRIAMEGVEEPGRQASEEEPAGQQGPVRGREGSGDSGARGAPGRARGSRPP